MRPNVDLQKIEHLMKVLGQEAQGSGSIYFTGGASALLIGWRNSTVDVDIRLDPEPLGIFQSIAKLKQELNINIELASPQDFLPPLPGWRDRSIFIARKGHPLFYHYARDDRSDTFKQCRIKRPERQPDSRTRTGLI